MTREEIIRLAREAGIPIETDWAGRPSTLVLKDGGIYLRGVDDLVRFAALIEQRAATAEREACAKICEQEHGACWHASAMAAAKAAERCANAIRARGEKS